MLNVSNKPIHLNRLLGMGAAGLLLATQAATCFGQSSVTDQGVFKFEAVDIDSNDQVDWAELSHPYEDQLSAAGWNQQEVINQFDQNNNGYLEEDEYQEFTASLQNTLGANQGLATNESEGLGASDPNDEGWFEFDDVEANNDDSVTWNELNDAYDDRISQVGWDEEQVMNRFDENRSGALEESEYLLLIGDLQTAQGQQGQMAARGDRQGQSAQNAMGQTQGQAQVQQGQAQSQQEQAGTGEGTMPVAIITILTVDETPQEISLRDLEDRQVVNLEGEEIGEVEDVVRSTVGTDTGLVVSVGGFWDIGDEEMYFSLDQFRLQGDQLVLQTRLDADAIEETDHFAYDEQNYTSLIDEYQASL